MRRLFQQISIPPTPGEAFRMNNNRALFVASFLTLIAAGFGFAVRGAILGDWGTQFDFTKQELGTITGMGFVGGGLTIILFSTITDRIGYKSILIGAFVLHALSAVVTLAATPIYAEFGKQATYNCLYWGMFMFSLANGLCETAINPLVATLFRQKKTHYLNMLHAGWPGGLILGGLVAYFFCGSKPLIAHVRWEIAIGLFLIPTAIYGVIVLKEKFPISEARAAGVSFGTMLLEFASPILLLLLVLHAMVGYVELGTDSWIQNIMNNVVGENAFLLFVYMSALMFILRFFAGPIVEKINPVGLLFCGVNCGLHRPDRPRLWQRRPGRSWSPERSMPSARRFSGRPCWAWWESGSRRGRAHHGNSRRNRHAFGGATRRAGHRL